MPGTYIDWSRVDTVLLDLDGTVLDLHFDNRFWTEHLPRRYAEYHGLEPASASERLAPIFRANEGHLNWYCTDFWSACTGLDVMALKSELASLVRPLPGALDFLDAVDARGLKPWLVTNAHPDVVDFKLPRTGLEGRFERVVSSHHVGWAKEDARFWRGLVGEHGLVPGRALFIDDSPAVVAAAHEFGVAQVVALTRPDSRGPERVHRHRPAVSGLSELIPT